MHQYTVLIHKSANSCFILNWYQITLVIMLCWSVRLWTADREWTSSLGLGEGITFPHHKHQLVTKCYTDDNVGINMVQERIR